MANPVVPQGQRDDLFDLTVTVNGVDGKTYLRVMDKMSGGAVMAKSAKYRPANGTVAEKALGAPQTFSDLKLTGQADVDYESNKKWLIGQVGKANVTVTRQPVDPNNVPYGTADVYKGMLDGLTPPEPDSQGDKASTFEIDVTAVSLT